MQGGHRGKSIVTLPLFLHRQTRFKIIIRTNIGNIFDEKNNELRAKASRAGTAGSSNQIYEVYSANFGQKPSLSALPVFRIEYTKVYSSKKTANIGRKPDSRRYERFLRIEHNNIRKHTRIRTAKRIFPRIRSLPGSVSVYRSIRPGTCNVPPPPRSGRNRPRPIRRSPVLFSDRRHPLRPRRRPSHPARIP